MNRRRSPLLTNLDVISSRDVNCGQRQVVKAAGSGNHDLVPLLPRPPITDPDAIVDYLRQRGLVDFLLSDVPPAREDWQRSIREAAEQAGFDILILPARELIILLNPHHVPSRDEVGALADVLNSWNEADAGTGEEPIGFDDALEQRRRRRLRPVVDEP
jgi:hypothetical protein